MTLTKGDKELLEKQDLYYDLMDRQYWDKQRKGSFWIVTTRQEYDRDTCEAIINLIIDCISNGGNKKLQEDAEKWNDYLKKIQSKSIGESVIEGAKRWAIVERLKDRIEDLDSWKGIRKEWHDRTIEELQKILGEEK